MKIATWNLEWAAMGTERNRRAVEYVESLEADIIVVTEHRLFDWPSFPHRIDGGADWGYPIVTDRRKVVALSREPWTNVRTIDERPMHGRYVQGTTTVDGVAVDVFAVCIPWWDAHTRTGYADKKRWGEHLDFCDRLGRELATATNPVVVAGDFNQRFPRNWQPQYAIDRLEKALGDLTVVTAGDTDVGQLIDHVAVSDHFEVVLVDAWPNTIDGVRLTDHSGVAVALS